MSFNADHLPEPTNEYVAWVDIMGIQSAMGRSLSISANFIFKLHIAALSTPRSDVQLYPIMDGFYATSPSKEEMLNFLRAVLSKIGQEFLDTENPLHRFIVRGALAFGPIVHGSQVTDKVNLKLADNEQYKSAIFLGMPVVQAYLGEHNAPPFGIFVHESARAFSPDREQPLHHVWWKWVRPELGNVWNNLLKKLNSHYEWCMERPNRLLYETSRVEIHKKLANEYFAQE
jgi:hypothetical protein